MRLQEEDAEVTIVGLKSDETYDGKSGLQARSEVSIGQIHPDEFDVLAIPGG